MTDPMEQRVCEGWARLSTIVTRGARHADVPAHGAFVNPPVSRGSTVVFPSIAAMMAQGEAVYEHELVYGAMGNPTQHMLERLVAEIENGTDTQVVGSGLVACALPLLAYTKAGDHILMTDSVYGPSRRFAMTMLKQFGVETTFYPPSADAETLQQAIRPTTRVIFAESPGSHSFEVQDIPMIAQVARHCDARLVVDNTWGFGVFSPFACGAHASVQALTKYAAGHSDVVLGAVTVSSKEDWIPLRDAAVQMGLCASPDDCWLAIRGLRTMPVRLEKQALNAYRVALFLSKRPQIARVLHPALPQATGHEIWQRDFAGAGSLFGVELDSRYSKAEMHAFLESLQLFSIGASWGGFESLVLPTTGMVRRDHSSIGMGGPCFRLQIGLEDVEELIKDLDTALTNLTT